MTSNVPSLQVAVADHAAIVRINGRANFSTSVSFKHLVSELRERGFERFVLDLTHCATMDSTFLGILARTALDLADHDGSGGVPASQAHGCDRVRLLNPNQRVSDLLDNLGIVDLFPIAHCRVSTAAERELAPANEAAPSREELSKTCLEAHLLLMSINPKNVSKFKDVAQFLAEDLKRLGASPEQPAEHRAEDVVERS